MKILSSLYVLFVGLIGSFFFFAFIYYALYLKGFDGMVPSNGVKIWRTPKPTFFLNESYNARIRATAANEMALLNDAEQFSPIYWTQFEPIDIPSNLPGAEGIERLRRANIGSLTAESLVKEMFPKYGNVKLTYLRNERGRMSGRSWLTVFGFPIIRNKLTQLELITEPNYSAFERAAAQRFNEPKDFVLGYLSGVLVTLVEPYAEKCPNPARCRQLLYAGLLEGVGHDSSVSLDSLAENLNFGDFFYFSVVAGTTTGYGDIVPVSTSARVINAIQILFTYCLLAFITARLVVRFTPKTN